MARSASCTYRKRKANVEIKMNKTMRDKLIEAWQYWGFRAKYARKRTWYFRAFAWLYRKLENRA